MMSNKNKGILIFAILYTVLFVFDLSLIHI